MITRDALVAQGAAVYPAFYGVQSPRGGVRFDPKFAVKNKDFDELKAGPGNANFFKPFNNDIDGEIVLRKQSPVSPATTSNSSIGGDPSSMSLLLFAAFAFFFLKRKK